VVIVTGAGGNLGAAVVRVLVERGWRLGAMDRTEAAPVRAVDGLDPGRIHPEHGVKLGDRERLFQADLFTALNMCRAAVPPMRAAGQGGIVTVGAAGAARAGKGRQPTPWRRARSCGSPRRWRPSSRTRVCAPTPCCR